MGFLAAVPPVAKGWGGGVTASLTLTATCSLAVFLEEPEASYTLPSRSTDMVKTGAWTGPDWDSRRYCSPGRIWLSRIRAFMGWLESMALLSRTEADGETWRVKGQRRRRRRRRSLAMLLELQLVNFEM